MADVLAPSGLCRLRTRDQADMVSNTHIREKAAEKTFSELGRLRA